MSGESVELLRALVALPTVAGTGNAALIALLRERLERAGARVHVFPADDEGAKANLHAVVGPTDVSGVMLAAHGDVVAVEGQGWTSDPFAATVRDGRVVGRGTADMKGFLACALRAIERAARTELRAPLHLAVSYDEELGCVGAPLLIEALARELPVLPRLCVVGEPTSMRVATAHKGKLAARATVRGTAAHSSLAPRAVNAVELAAELVGSVAALGRELAAHGPHDARFEIPHATVSTGRFVGGAALNVVPERASFEFELRPLPGQDAALLLERVRAVGAALAARDARASVVVEQTGGYPALDDSGKEDLAAWVARLAGHGASPALGFGTEAGLYDTLLGTPSVVCGPGDIAVAHRADESIALEQLAACDAFLGRLVDALADGPPAPSGRVRR